MQVLSVASEVYPLVKTGGLADVAGALPLALKGHGVRVRTLMPGYPAVVNSYGSGFRTCGDCAASFSAPVSSDYVQTTGYTSYSSGTPVSNAVYEAPCSCTP